jgi:hypothetical protein
MLVQPSVCTWRDFPVAKFPVHVPRTFVNAVQHLRDYGTFSPVNRNRGRSRSRRVLDLERWSLKFCKLLRKNRMLVADDLHYEWVFPVSQFGERCTNKDYGLHPYHLQRIQHLKPEDPPRRIAFCRLTCGQV